MTNTHATNDEKWSVEDILRAYELLKPLAEKIQAIDAYLAGFGLRANLDSTVSLLLPNLDGVLTVPPPGLPDPDTFYPDLVSRQREFP